ncbi:uncharacterized protein BX664DRAFT_290996 [Halteromyces radiatus]|uniref:uncharacterized protein n=1 Tax=Halteromyces radiatus TaxID=101107 RepID=UPI00221F4BCF|nr:uncharacterized protein BX664DRAFT_290996 [Halteromyces radiatus]KAI8096241.1 hypothetical protein BX664DRAFT_290996 [Halteromyces radiatus]
MIDLGHFLLSTGMIFGPVIGYIDQYRLINQTKTSTGFHPKTCAILLFANILRIFFWFGKRFDTTLLIQSIVMIVSQLILLELVIRYRPTPTLMSDDDDDDESLSIEADHPWQRAWQQRHSFWNWPTFLDYLNFLLAFTTCISLLYVFFRHVPSLIELLGLISLGIESTLPLPQCISNYKNRSTAGFSLLVLMSWFFGDSFKVFYYISNQAPYQFILCGGIQLTIDFLIVLECIIFSSKIKKWLGSSLTSRSDYEPLE